MYRKSISQKFTLRKANNGQIREVRIRKDLLGTFTVINKNKQTETLFLDEVLIIVNLI